MNKKHKIVFISIFILILMALIYIWVTPNMEIKMRIIFSFLIIFLFLMFFVRTFADKKRLIKTIEGVPIISNFENWNLQKGKYLKTSISIFFSSTLSSALGITLIILVTYNNYNIPPENTINEFFASPVFIIGCLFLINLLIGSILIWWNRIICSKLFYNKNFAEEVNLKKLSWFFKKEFRINIFIWLHMSSASIVLAIIIYKDIGRIIFKQINNNNVL